MANGSWVKGSNAPVVFDFPKTRWVKVAGGGAHGRMKAGMTGKGERVRTPQLDPEWNEAECCTKEHIGESSREPSSWK